MLKKIFTKNFITILFGAMAIVPNIQGVLNLDKNQIAAARIETFNNDQVVNNEEAIQPQQTQQLAVAAGNGSVYGAINNQNKLDANLTKVWLKTALVLSIIGFLFVSGFVEYLAFLGKRLATWLSPNRTTINN